MRERRYLTLLSAAMLAGAPAPALAHAFGQRYDLPLPLGHFLAGAGAAVAFSFAVAAIAFWRREPVRRLELRLIRRIRPVWRRTMRAALGSLGIGLLAITLVAGFFGAVSPSENPAPVLVWVLWWVGLLLACAFAGNLWPALNPWSAMWRAAGPLLPDVLSKPPAPVGAALAASPEHGAPPSPWLAVLALFVFVACEIAGTFGEAPGKLAWLIVAYSVLTWAGMAFYGHDRWLARADPFHRVFALFGAFAPLALRDAGQPDGPAALVIRPPGAGLYGCHQQDFAGVAFIILVLASVSFDGFSETPLWAGILEWIAASRDLRGTLLWLSGLGLDLLASIKIAGLLCAVVVLMAVYAAVCRISEWAAGEAGTGRSMRVFAASLLPIAIAYHLSHYLSYLVLAGQLMIPIASDPFALGWDLFGTRNYALDIGIIGARDVWHVSVVALVSGHILSVFLAHAEASRLYSAPAAALRSQIPFIVLMTGFTMASLWILAQPVVEPAL